MSGFDEISKRDVLGAVQILLERFADDPDRDGLEDTPSRVFRALRELTDGYNRSAGDVLSTTFDVDGTGSDGIVSVRDVRFYSLCEHHLLPFIGAVSIAYLPEEDGEVVGLSKLARLVEVFARRLQVQERLTRQIAESIWEYLDCEGVFVRVEARHLCMRMRGVEKDAPMVTSVAFGLARERDSVKQEMISNLEAGS